MADRNGYIGRAPSDSSVTIARQTNQPTGIQTAFVFSSGYDVGLLDVYVNGSKLVNALDYTATDTQNVTLTTPAQGGDVVEFVAYKAFNLTNVVTATTGDLTVDGSVTATGNISGLSFIGDGSQLTGIDATALKDGNGDVRIQANTFGAVVTGILTANVSADTLVVSGLTTTTNEIEIRSTDGTPARVDYYCEVNNAHYARIQAPPHSEFSGNVTSILPTKSGDIIVGDTNGTITQHINTTGIVTASSFVGSGASLTQLSNTELVNYSEKVNTVGNTASNVNINVANGTFVTATLAQNTTFAFTSPASGTLFGFTLKLTNGSGGPFTITWPASVKWSNNVTPVRTTTDGRTDIWNFFTSDGGTSWYGSISLYNFVG